MTKSIKSHQRERSPLFENSVRVPELVARSSAWQVRAAKDKVKIGDFAALRNLNYTTRANISHEIAEQIRARKPARPLKVQGGRESSTRADESKDFCQPSPVGEGGARSVTDEVSFVKKDLKILCAYRTFA